MRFIFLAALTAFLFAGCAKKQPVTLGGPGGSTPTANVPPTTPEDPFLPQEEMYVDKHAEFALSALGYSSNQNCIRLYRNKAGSAYAEFRSGPCTAPGPVQFNLTLSTSELSQSSVKVGQYVYDAASGEYEIFDLCTRDYASSTCKLKVTSGVLKCISFRADGACE